MRVPSLRVACLSARAEAGMNEDERSERTRKQFVVSVHISRFHTLFSPAFR